jgi:O-antigen/teichoic acid export membrane protein
MVNYTKWLIFHSGGSYLIDWGGNFVLRPFVSFEKIGDYNLGYLIFKGISILISAISGYFLPFVSQNVSDPDAMRNYMSNKRPKIFALGLVGIVLLFIAAPHIVQLVYGEGYSNSNAVLAILLIASILVLYNCFYIPILNALKEFKFNVLVSILQSILSILAGVVLVSRYGMLGAAVGTVIGYLFTTSMLEGYYRIKLKKSLMPE